MTNKGRLLTENSEINLQMSSQQSESTIMQRFSNVNSFLAHSSYGYMTELDRVESSFY